jgi:Domain of unknown function (DUF222)
VGANGRAGSLSVARSTVFGMTGAGFNTVDEVMRHAHIALSAVNKLIDAEYSKLNGGELLDFGRVLEILNRKVWAAQVHLVDELHQQHVAAARSMSSTEALIRDVFGISPGEAGARVKAARELLPQDDPDGGETPARRPLLRSVLDAGLIDREHVRTALATFRRFPDDLPADLIEHAEQILVEHAVAEDPTRFAQTARRLENDLNPDGHPSDDAVHAKMEFSIGSRSATTGLTGISGHLDDLGIATLRTVVDALATPKPAVDGVADQRPAATRRAHALIEALNFVATYGDTVLPDTGGERPRVNVTLDWDVAREAAGAAMLDGGTLLSPGATRRLLCDAAVIPAVLGGNSEVLDVGRSTRTFTTATRRAIALRDQGCVWPGCDRPPSWCETHHRDWWVRDLGTTGYDNGVLLCSFHHGEIHRSQWEVRFAADGRAELIPPKWLDPKREPRRNTLNHINPIRRD